MFRSFFHRKKLLLLSVGLRDYFSWLHWCLFHCLLVSIICRFLISWTDTEIRRCHFLWSDQRLRNHRYHFRFVPLALCRFLLRKGKIRVHKPSLLLSSVIISSPSTINIIVSFEPLYQFQIILVLSLRQFFNLNIQTSTSICFLTPSLSRVLCNIFRLLIN